jgi:hypothetical protein
MAVMMQTAVRERRNTGQQTPFPPEEENSLGGSAFDLRELYEFISVSGDWIR